MKVSETRLHHQVTYSNYLPPPLSSLWFVRCSLTEIIPSETNMNQHYSKSNYNTTSTITVEHSS